MVRGSPIELKAAFSQDPETLPDFQVEAETLLATSLTQASSIAD